MWLLRRRKFPAPAGSASADPCSSAAFVRYLEDILPASAAEPARARLTQFKIRSASEQDRDLPELYLLLEQEIAGAAGDVGRTRAALQQVVAKHFAPLLSRSDFGLIFAPAGRQELLLCRRLIGGTLDHAFVLLGATGNDFLRSLSAWIDAVPEASLPLPFDLGQALPTRDGEWVTLFFRLARELYLYLEAKLGENCARSFYERSYNDISRRYARLETFPVVVNLLPEALLDSEKIGRLSRSQIQKVLLQKLSELNDINTQLRNQYDELDLVRNELVEARDELERRVAERTAELSTANQQLLREIAVRQQAEQDLRAAKDAADIANRAKSEFLANMSHELRTPLNAIIGFSEIIKEGRHGPLQNPQYESYAEDIHSSGEHLLSIINAILDMAKIEAGKIELREAEVDVAHAVAASVELMGPRAADAKVEIRVAAAPDLPALYADERLVRQSLLNLLSNAVKFTQAGGTVAIETRVEASGGLAILVRDTGVGIAPADAAKVLAPFGQVDSRLSRQQGGTGLGLPLAKSFIELHGGSLTLDSRIGAGTTVTMRFPPERVLGARAPGSSSAKSNIVAFAKSALPR